MTTLATVLFLAFLAGICGTLLVGLRVRNVPAVVNAAGSLAVALLAAGVEIAVGTVPGNGFAVASALSTWIAAAGFLHSVGMLGWYDSTWWWDHLTHTLSAAFVAALVYAGLHTLASHDPSFQLSTAAIAGLTVLFTAAVGVFWEFLELVVREIGERHDVEPVLEHYGLRDTVLDLVFDVVGAAVVVALDLRVFVPVTDGVPQLVESLLLGTTVVVLAGTVGMGLLLGVGRETGSDHV